MEVKCYTHIFNPTIKNPGKQVKSDFALFDYCNTIKQPFTKSRGYQKVTVNSEHGLHISVQFETD